MVHPANSGTETRESAILILSTKFTHGCLGHNTIFDRIEVKVSIYYTSRGFDPASVEPGLY